jgi:hypothetical protein
MLPVKLEMSRLSRGDRLSSFHFRPSEKLRIAPATKTLEFIPDRTTHQTSSPIATLRTSPPPNTTIAADHHDLR